MGRSSFPGELCMSEFIGELLKKIVASLKEIGRLSEEVRWKLSVGKKKIGSRVPEIGLSIPSRSNHLLIDERKSKLERYVERSTQDEGWHPSVALQPRYHARASALELTKPHRT
ncbi:hypothetical protein Tco_1212475 [Tanacetum coccineum]